VTLLSLITGSGGASGAPAAPRGRAPESAASALVFAGAVEDALATADSMEVASPPPDDCTTGDLNQDADASGDALPVPAALPPSLAAACFPELASVQAAAPAPALSLTPDTPTDKPPAVTPAVAAAVTASEGVQTSVDEAVGPAPTPGPPGGSAATVPPPSASVAGVVPPAAGARSTTSDTTPGRDPRTLVAAQTPASRSSDAVPATTSPLPRAAHGSDVAETGRDAASALSAGTPAPAPAGSPLPPTGPAVHPLVGTAPASTAAAPAPIAHGAAPAAPPLRQQLTDPVVALARGAEGEHRLTLTVAPESLGPVTVRARISGGAIHIELHAPSDLGRDALRAVLTDLRRDLAATAPHATLAVAAQDTSPGSPSSPHSQTSHGDTAAFSRGGRHEPPARRAAPAPPEAPPPPPADGIDIYA